MQIVCSWCKAELGEKCHRCGSSNVVQTEPGVYFCQVCEESFHAGEGGGTDSLCPPCREEHVGPAARSAVTAPAA